MNIIFKEMNISHHNQLMKLWSSIDGLCIDEEDLYENMILFLNRNAKLSYVAFYENEIIASIKGAQDGRRGYISHLAVSPQFRNQGIAKHLCDKTLIELKNQGILKYNIYVLNSNTTGLNFWKNNGWDELKDNFKVLQKNMRA